MPDEKRTALGARREAGVRRPRPVLVTGAHRSGTTWVGKMLAAAPRTDYLFEPFNVSRGACTCGTRFRHWFTYVCDENEDEFIRHIGNVLRPTWDHFPLLDTSARQPRSVGGGRLLSYLARRCFPRTPIFKDPIAVFSSEWLARRFDMHVVVLVRHPAGFASSLKRLGWRHPFRDFLDQPLLMRDVLHPFESRIAEFAARDHDIMEQAGLLWTLIHHAVDLYAARNPGWMVVRHMDLARSPLEGLREMFQRCGLGFNEEVERSIRDHSAASNPSEMNGGVQSIRRDSLASLGNWRRRLRPDEVHRLRELVEPQASRYFGEEDW